jgi:hypothetical protein
MLDELKLEEEKELYLQCDRCGLKYGKIESLEDYNHIDDCGMCVSCDDEIEVKL